jgi:hypothetical protein
VHHCVADETMIQTVIITQEFIVQGPQGIAVVGAQVVVQGSLRLTVQALEEERDRVACALLAAVATISMPQ